MSEELGGFMSRDYIYYIQTDGSAEMNRMIGDALAEQSCVCECVELQTKNGKVPAFECPDYEFFRRFEEAAKSLSGKYRIWVKEGKAVIARHFDGNIRAARCDSGHASRSKQKNSARRATFKSLRRKLGVHNDLDVRVSVKVS